MSSSDSKSETKPKYRKTHPEMPLDIWVEERKNKDNVKFYKSRMSLSSKYPQLRAEGFVLFLQTKPQVDLLKKHGEKLVCVDKQSGGYYEVLTVIIIDNLGHSFPCASVFTDRVDQAVVEVCFSEIKSEIGNVKVQILMAGKDQFITDTWNQVIERPEKTVISSWEIFKEWKTKLNDLVKNKNKQSVILKQLKSLLNEEEKEIFKQESNKLVSELIVDVETVQFALYLSGDYFQNINSWAPCFCFEENFKFDYEMEIMHETFKNVLRDKTTGRLDRALNNILELTRSKVYDRLLLMSGGKSKLNALAHKHDYAQKQNFSIIQKESHWIVDTLSGKKEKTKIRFRDKDCKCVQKCNACGVCSHVYMCSCADSSVRLNMCRHIHGLCMHLTTGKIELSVSDSEESDVETKYVPVVKSRNIKTLKKDKKITQQDILHETRLQETVVEETGLEETGLQEDGQEDYIYCQVIDDSLLVYENESGVVYTYQQEQVGECQVEVESDAQETQLNTEPSLDSMKLNVEHMFMSMLDSVSNKQQLKEIENALHDVKAKMEGVKTQRNSRKRPSAKVIPSHDLQESAIEGLRKIKSPRKMFNN